MQKGFTLVELLVVVAISAVITMAAGTVIIRIYSESERSSERLTASQQVQNAGFWLKGDASEAQAIMLDDPETITITELVTLVWYGWDNKIYRAAYTLENSGGLKKLMRRYSIDGGSPQVTFVADSIVEASTSAGWDGYILTLNITAQVGDQDAARIYQVKPRPLII